MDMTASRTNLFSLIAACIVAVGLIAASLIIAHRPLAIVTHASSSPSLSIPPLTQESVGSQFRTQVLAAPILHTFQYAGVNYTLKDVKVTHVVYSPKDDDFSIVYSYVWQPSMPADGPQGDVSTLGNDGYGHYYGPVVLSPIVGGTGQNAYVTIR